MEGLAPGASGSVVGKGRVHPLRGTVRLKSKGRPAKERGSLRRPERSPTAV